MTKLMSCNILYIICAYRTISGKSFIITKSQNCLSYKGRRSIHGRQSYISIINRAYSYIIAVTWLKWISIAQCEGTSAYICPSVRRRRNSRSPTSWYCRIVRPVGSRITRPRSTTLPTSSTSIITRCG